MAIVPAGQERPAAMTYRVFISHSAADRAALAAVWQGALAAGVHPYIYEHDERPGTMVADKLQAEIRGSDAVILLLTKQSVVSPYVQQEIGYALAHRKPVLPLVELGVAEDKLAMLKGVEWMAFDPTDPSSALQTIAGELGRLRSQKQNQEDLLVVVGLVAAMVLLVYLSSS
jgi:nucleoside 2-deoxyribosyltransferase